MDTLFKLCAAVMVALVLLMLLEHREKHIAVLLCVVICCIMITVSVDFLQPIIQLIKRMQRTAALDSTLLALLMKMVAIAVTCEITAMICAESGYGSLGKTLQYSSMIIILHLSIPLFSRLLDTVAELLGGI